MRLHIFVPQPTHTCETSRYGAPREELVHPNAPYGHSGRARIRSA